MDRSLYRACMVQLQLLLAREPRPAAPEIDRSAPNFMQMMRIKR